MTDKEQQKDILDELRSAALYRGPEFSVCDKAADEIERLRSEIDWSRTALRAAQTAPTQSDAKPDRSGPADYIPIGGAGNGA